MQLLASGRQNLADLTQFVAYNRGGVPLGYWMQHLFVLAFGAGRVSARLSAVAFGVLSLVAGVRLARCANARLGALFAVFATMPLILRYAVEARPYSQALFFSLAATWWLWRSSEKPSIKAFAVYSALVAAALYSQPYSVLGQFGGLAALAYGKRRQAAKFGFAALALSFVSFVPWYLYARALWASAIVSNGQHVAITFRVIPVVAKEFSGGGYVASFALIGGAVLGWKAAPRESRVYLLANSLAAVRLALLSDWSLRYFYAARQLIFALTPLIVLAVSNLGDLYTQPRRWAMLALLVASAIFKDVTYFRSPSGDWQSAAKVLGEMTDQGACAITLQADIPEFYEVFEPRLEGRFCSLASTQALVAVVSQRSMPSNPSTVSDTLRRRGCRASRVVDAGSYRVTLYLPFRPDQ